MDSNKVHIDLNGKSHTYDVEIGDDSLKKCGIWARSCLSKNTGKIALISNEKVFGLYGNEVRQSFINEGFEVLVWLMEDGEEFKNFESLQKSLEFLGENKINRTDAIVALGGGVVGDLAGFAAAVYLRGIQFLQIPTTVLAMIDSSVGGKTAVNTAFGKNLVGAFYQPAGVLVDVRTLATLEHREIVAGFCEAIKQGAIGSRRLFDKTAEFLKKHKLEDFSSLLQNNEFNKELINLLASQISFKAEIVMQDELEATARSDNRSRKILNFGHTTAHALEKITNYKYFKHGEAVGLGILVAAEISKGLEICDENSINLLNDVVSCVGTLPTTNDIDIDEVLKLFIFDKKSIGKSLQWILLEEIGKPQILSNEHIPQTVIRTSLLKILHN